MQRQSQLDGSGVGYGSRFRHQDRPSFDFAFLASAGSAVSNYLIQPISMTLGKNTMPEDEIIDTSEQEDAEVTVPLRYSITSYGADYPIDGLVERLKRGDISLPGFQRRFVWNQAQASRFIESLLLGLPVPGIFLFREPASQRLTVVDGHQRLQSLQSYYEDSFRNKAFALKGVSASLSGLQYKNLEEHDRRILDNSILHATIFQQLNPPGDKGSIFEVFERLNTTGVPLSQQEIRECIYRGSFNELLNELNGEDSWRGIYGIVSNRAKDKELILRFFALKHRCDSYSRPLKRFLNEFMETYAHADHEWIEQRRTEFNRVTRFAAEWLPREAFRRTNQLNSAIADAMLVGLSRRLDTGPISGKDSLGSVALALIECDKFREFTDRTTTDVAAVKGRIELATRAFGEAR